ncbi:hypothetical protein [Aeromicrobium sp.]
MGRALDPHHALFAWLGLRGLRRGEAVARRLESLVVELGMPADPALLRRLDA